MVSNNSVLTHTVDKSSTVQFLMIRLLPKTSHDRSYVEPIPPSCTLQIYADGMRWLVWTGRTPPRRVLRCTNKYQTRDDEWQSL